MNDGKRVNTWREWREIRRPELIELFKMNMYGNRPLYLGTDFSFEISADEQALNGAAFRKEVIIKRDGIPGDCSMTLLMYLPAKIKRRARKIPVFLGLNFYGNGTINEDPSITISKSWIPTNRITMGKPPAMLRGIQSSSWPIEYILKCGYGLATIYCGDILLDRNDGLEIAMSKWAHHENIYVTSLDSWGAIDGWAWGLSRAMDYLEKDPDIDQSKIAVIGHSRLGKAALWAGCLDERFAIVYSNESGLGGAKLSRHLLGESIAQINASFPHWFCGNFKTFNNREADLPFDQHELISLIAPRPVYIASAQRDLHADPMGEFLAAKFASLVYEFLGTSGLPAAQLPPVNSPIKGAIGYHMRKGRHGITLYDWEQFIAFADFHFSIER